MRFEEITAHAFGPLRGAKLAPAPGMTVVYGPNEAGKSSWHAAIYAALCGMRRSRGGPRSEDREFTERHYPWEGDGWDVSARLELADGRKIEIRQDLDGKVDCRAVDLTIGRDVSAEVISEGAPDGSRWLGLGRCSFLATACVRQAEIVSVLHDPSSLQEDLQRAAATAGRDETAAAAIEAIATFRRENVGLDRANARGPLRKAKEKLDRARGGLARTKDAHEDYLRLVADVEEKVRQRDELEHKRRGLARILAAEEEKKVVARLSRLHELARKLPEDAPPPQPLSGIETARRVAAAVEAWRNRPAIPDLDGPTAAELERELALLPAVPEGDREPHESVTEAAARLRTALEVLAAHERERPAAAPVPEAGGASAEELRARARDLEEPEPIVDPALAERVAAAQREVERTRPGERRKLAVLVAAGSIAGGGVLAALGYTVAGVAVAGVGLVAAVLLLLAGSSSSHERALAELHEAESRHGIHEQIRMSVAARRDEARARIEALGLVSEPGRLRELAQRLDSTVAASAAAGRWETRQELLRGTTEEAREALHTALHERGAEVSADVEASLASYRAVCAARERLGAEAARGRDVAGRLGARRSAEAAVAEARAACKRALATLRAAAADAGIADEDPEEIAAALDTWLSSHAEELRRVERLALEYKELETLLAGRPTSVVIAELEERLVALRATLAATPATEEASLDEPAARARLASLTARLRELESAIDVGNGAVADRTGRLPRVADAEEELAEAERELERVQRLDATLARTLGFLERAEERVHRDVSVMLADTVRPWLPKVTAGRYSDVLVDPEDLSVQVRDPRDHWRDAALLSHGTMEQIYLLLRVALAEHMTAKGERCPLLLDEVTVQSDRERTEQILDLLHALSAERQIILFTQEEDVREWAEARFANGTDRLIELPKAAA